MTIKQERERQKATWYRAVTSEDFPVESIDPDGDQSLDYFLADLVEGFSGPSDPETFGQQDLVVWQGAKLIAAVTADEHGRPVVTRFFPVIRQVVVVNVLMTPPEATTTKMVYQPR